MLKKKRFKKHTLANLYMYTNNKFYSSFKNFSTNLLSFNLLTININSLLMLKHYKNVKKKIM